MLKIVTPPTESLVTVEEIKTQMGIYDDGWDDFIGVTISAVQEMGEHRTRCSLATQTLELMLDGFYQPERFPAQTIYLPMGPVQSITSLKYIDTDGVEQSLSADEYDTDIETQIARIRPLYGEIWPETNVQFNAVRVRYEAGLTSDDKWYLSVRKWMFARIKSHIQQQESIHGGTQGNFIKLMPHEYVDCLLDPLTVMEF